jgi:hypothetical protein
VYKAIHVRASDDGGQFIIGANGGVARPAVLAGALRLPYRTAAVGLAIEVGFRDLDGSRQQVTVGSVPISLG